MNRTILIYAWTIDILTYCTPLSLINKAYEYFTKWLAIWYTIITHTLTNKVHNQTKHNTKHKFTTTTSSAYSHYIILALLIIVIIHTHTYPSTSKTHSHSTYLPQHQSPTIPTHTTHTQTHNIHDITSFIAQTKPIPPVTTITITTYIGTIHHITHTHLKTPKIKTIHYYTWTNFKVLLLSGDIETNPGPPSHLPHNISIEFTQKHKQYSTRNTLTKAQPHSMNSHPKGYLQRIMYTIYLAFYYPYTKELQLMPWLINIPPKCTLNTTQQLDPRSHKIQPHNILTNKHTKSHHQPNKILSCNLILTTWISHFPTTNQPNTTNHNTHGSQNQPIIIHTTIDTLPPTLQHLTYTHNMFSHTIHKDPHTTTIQETKHQKLKPPTHLDKKLTHTHQKPSKTKNIHYYTWNISTIILLSGDIQLNPGPITNILKNFPQ